MPYYQDSMSQGDLNIQFEIEFPKSRSLTAAVTEKLKEVKHISDFVGSSSSSQT